MKNTYILTKYRQSWKNRLRRDPGEVFDKYERNWVLPQLMQQGESVLDLASGNSIVGQYWQKNYGAKVIAFDISDSAIKDAAKRGVKGIVGSAEEKLPFKSASFDTVFWGDNIEHVLSIEFIMKEIHRVLKPGGRLILSTPNQAYWRYRLYMFIQGALPHTEGEQNPPWNWGHIRFFNRPILHNLFAATGFIEQKFLGVSRRRIDRLFLTQLPQLFGMIMVVEAERV
jgi:methionine biosynthesis protein MetW